MTVVKVQQFQHPKSRLTSMHAKNERELFIATIAHALPSLNTLSGVTSERCPSPRLCTKAHTIKGATVASRW